MSSTIRKTVRALLLNQNNELLLMRIEGLDCYGPDGIKHDSFWATIGGSIDEGETLEQALSREIYEETGITSDNITLGPLVWHSTIELLFRGTPTLFDASYIIATTTQLDISSEFITEYEKETIKEYRWWSLHELQNTKETIFPIHLQQYIADIIAGNYPKQPINIDIIKEF